MKEQLAVQSILREKLLEIQNTNSRYSLRAYARKVGVHVGSLTHIINGKRKVSRKLAERIADRLLLDPQQRSEILGLFPQKVKYSVEESQKFSPRYLKLTADQFKVAAEWEHFAILSLANCEEFVGETSWIAERLGLTESKTDQVIERLLELGLFEKKNRRIFRSKKSCRTPDDVAHLSIKKHHDQSLDLAKTSLFRDEISARDFTSITMAIDPKKIKLAKEAIRKFEDELADLLETGSRTEVYRLSVQLFPLSKIKTKE